jgi:hypothetical protein
VPSATEVPRGAEAPPSRIAPTLLPLGLLGVAVAWKLAVLNDVNNHVLALLPKLGKALCIVQDAALATLFALLTVALGKWRRWPLLLVPLANALALLEILDARSKMVFFQPFSLEMALLGVREWHTIAGAAKYYVSQTFLFEVAVSLAALNATLFIPPLWRRRAPVPRRVWWIAGLASLGACPLVPARASQAHENVVVASLLAPLRGLRGAAPPTLARAAACEQPLRRRAPASALHGAARGRNVLVLIAESWSYDDTSFGDRAGDHTPFARELGAVGPIAGQAWSQFPHSTKALFGILMGHYASPGLEVHEATVPRFESLARELGARGYQSAFFTNQSLRYQNTQMQYRRMGFEPVYDELSLRRSTGRWVRFSDQDLVDELDRMLPARQPFFHVIYNFDTHQPYTPPDPAPAGETDHQRYLRSLRSSDAVFRQVVDKLKARGAYENTIIVLVGDHGDNFDESGHMAGRGCRLTRREHLVPLVVAAPGLRATPVQLTPDAPARQIDIVPTLRDLLGLEDGLPVQGQSLLAGPPPPALLNSFGACDRAAFVEHHRKLTYDAREDQAWSSDVEADPEERARTSLTGEAKSALVARLAACADYDLAQAIRPELAAAR